VKKSCEVGVGVCYRGRLSGELLIALVNLPWNIDSAG